MACPFHAECPTDLPPHWVRPTLVVEVEYRERFANGLRHPSLKALRADKQPEKVRLPSPGSDADA